jgi:hypothetical protein
MPQQPLPTNQLCPVCKEGEPDYYTPGLYSCGTRKTPAGIAASDKCLSRQKFRRELMEELKASAAENLPADVRHSIATYGLNYPPLRRKLEERP